MPVTVPLRALTRRADRRAVLTWAGPGEPVKIAPGSTLTPGERLAVLAHLTDRQEIRLADAAGDLSGELPEAFYATTSAEALTVALQGLAGATGVAPAWGEAEGLALEEPAEDLDPQEAEAEARARRGEL